MFDRTEKKTIRKSTVFRYIYFFFYLPITFSVNENSLNGFFSPTQKLRELVVVTILFLPVTNYSAEGGGLYCCKTVIYGR